MAPSDTRRPTQRRGVTWRDAASPGETRQKGAAAIVDKRRRSERRFGARRDTAEPSETRQRLERCGDAWRKTAPPDVKWRIQTRGTDSRGDISARIHAAGGVSE